jgi:hypothetical protein
MKNLIKKSLFLAAVLGILVSPSCTQRQVGKGAAVVAVGTAIGAAVIIDDANRREGRYDRRPHYPKRHDGRYDRRPHYPHRQPQCRTVRVCNNYIDYYGNVREQCDLKRRCRGQRHYFMALNEGGFEAINEALNDKSVTEVIDVVDFAKAHDLSFEGAEKFASALDAAKEGDFDKLEELGLAKKDIESIAMLRMPSDEAFTALSKSLDQYEVITKGMIGRMLVKARKYQKELEESED